MCQLKVIQPKAVVCLGAVALQALLGPGVAISRVRGQWMDFHGMQMMPTYHPAFLLRNPAAKRSVWEDLKKVMALLGLEPALVRGTLSLHASGRGGSGNFSWSFRRALLGRGRFSGAISFASHR